MLEPGEVILFFRMIVHAPPPVRVRARLMLRSVTKASSFCLHLFYSLHMQYDAQASTEFRR